MFGKRNGDPATPRRLPQQPANPAAASASAPVQTEAKAVPAAAAPIRVEPEAPKRRHSEEYYDVKTTVFNALIDTYFAQYVSDSAAAETVVTPLSTSWPPYMTTTLSDTAASVP